MDIVVDRAYWPKLQQGLEAERHASALRWINLDFACGVVASSVALQMPCAQNVPDINDFQNETFCQITPQAAEFFGGRKYFFGVDQWEAQDSAQLETAVARRKCREYVLIGRDSPHLSLVGPELSERDQ